jgi:hypothetical protein
MGGFGSTRWAWTSTRDTVESARSLDINRLNRAGCLRPGYWGGWEWTRDGKPVADIRVRAEAQCLMLSYRIRRNGGEWRDVEQLAQVVWVPCRFGGKRPYFLCPGVVNGIACGRRVSKLYGAGLYFLCRHCYRLAYCSQREDQLDRALNRASKIRMRLGGGPGMASPFPEKPKGMHGRTYNRLQDKVYQAEMLADEKLALTVARLTRIESRMHRRSRVRRQKEFWK